MLFKNFSIRSKLLTIVGVVAALFCLTFFFLIQLANRQLASSVRLELERSSKVASEFVESRFRQLDAGLHSLVETPEIRAVLATDGIDHDTQLMSIIDLQHMLAADVVLYCDTKGKTLARTDDPFDESTSFADLPMVQEAMTSKIGRGFWKQNDNYLLTIAFPVLLDGQLEGVVMAGVSLSKDAQQLSSLLLRDVVLRLNGECLSSSVAGSFDEEGAISGVFVQQLRTVKIVQPESIVNASDVRRLPVSEPKRGEGGSQIVYASVGVLSSEFPTLEAVVLVPAESIYGFFNELRTVLALMGVLTISLSVGIIFGIGAIISSQVRRTLTVLEAVAAGDLRQHLDIDSKDEFGRIAKSLNTAVRASADTLDALAVRNRDTRMLLDAVEQGFFTIDSQGRMSDERSGAVERVFGQVSPGTTFGEFLDRFDSTVASWFEMGLEEVFAEIMPLELTIDQLPKRFCFRDRTYSIQYTPVFLEGALQSLAVVLSDITAIVNSEKLETAQREMLAIVQRVADDRPGFIEFFEEANSIIKSLRNDSRDDLVLTKRRVHTLKGNTSLFGFEIVAGICHQMEDYIAENNTLPEEKAWDELFSAWDEVTDKVHRILGKEERGILIPEHQFSNTLNEISTLPRESLAMRVASWGLEPTERRLQRVAEQARVLARRLCKGEIEVNVSSGDLRVQSERWSDFWSSFVHVVRNAVDHGLETPEERLAAGKPSPASIELRTEIVDDQYVISISDNGRGINWSRVAKAAEAKALPAQTHDDLIQALFEDGVSTASVVTDTSGRGVGMAAVKACCLKLNGRITVDSVAGQGTTFRFSFPIDSIAPDTTELLMLRDIESIRQFVVDTCPQADRENLLAV